MTRQTFEELIYANTADGTAIANTTTETAIFSPATIPANYLTGNRVLHGLAFGKYSDTATPTLRLRLRWGTATGGVVLIDSGAITLATMTANTVWMVEFWLTSRTNGATGTVMGFGIWHPGVSALTTPVPQMMTSAGATAPAAATIDDTADTALNLTATWSAASASNTLTGHSFYLFSKN